MHVVVTFGLFITLHLLACRILPLGLLCEKLLCLCAVALVPLPATPVTPLRVSPICWMRESLSSTPAVVLPTLSNVVLEARRIPRLFPVLLVRQSPCHPIR